MEKEGILNFTSEIPVDDPLVREFNGVIKVLSLRWISYMSKTVEGLAVGMRYGEGSATKTMENG